jgi:hypothetical protein
MSWRRGAPSLGGLVALCATLSISASTAAAKTVRAHAAGAYQQCTSPYAIAPPSATNPLALPTAPGADPLSGATFFVDGPRHGLAAGAIVQLLGMSPASFADDYSWADLEQQLGINPIAYHDNYSWAQFQQDIASGPLAQVIQQRTAADPKVPWKIFQLTKIADQPEAQRFSEFSGGGGPGAIQQQVIKLFCYNLRADPGSIPVIETFFIYPRGQYCPTLQEMLLNWPTFKRQIDEMRAGTDQHPAVFLLELDSIGSSACLFTNGSETHILVVKHHKKKKRKKHHRKHKPKHAADLRARAAGAAPPNCATGSTTRIAMWECMLRYEVDQMSTLPHVVVYTEAGYSDGTSIAHAVEILNKVDVSRIRGFYTNDTHNAWTINEVKWAQTIASKTGGKHFIVNTATNGQGPLVPPNRVKYGNEVTCNPVGRGLGPTATAATGQAGADAYLWTFVPGRSSGNCAGNFDCTHLAGVCAPGGPAPGDFWVDRAVDLASHADRRIGPSPYPSLPY